MPEPPPESPDSEPLVPALALAVYIACVGGAGALANCTLLAALLKSATNGVYSIIIQLAVTDFIIIATSVAPELWSTNAKTWQFGSGACSAYQGLRVFASTASSYLIVTLALHTLATINLEEKAAIKRNKRNLQDEDEEMRSSRHSLVANSDSSTPPRTMNVDYRLSDTSVPVAPPATFVWVLAASLSIPEFVLATVVHMDRENVQCTSVDTNHQVNMHTLLAVFELFLPIVIMVVAGILVIIKLKTKKRILEMWNRESIATLKLSISLIVMYGVFCAPRSITSVYHVYSMSSTGGEVFPMNLAPRSYEIAIISLGCTAAYLAATIVRPVLCIFLLPRLKKVVCGSRGDDTIDNV